MSWDLKSWINLVNELLSITENLGLMGVPVPKVLSGAIDLLRQKSEEQKAKQVHNSPFAP